MGRRTHIKHNKRYYKVRKRRQIEAICLASFCASLAIFIVSTSMGQVIRLRIYGLFVETSQYLEESLLPKERSIPQVERLFYIEADAETASKEGYSYIKKSSEDLHKGNLILVNAAHAAAFLENNQLVDVKKHKNKSYKVAETEIWLNKRAANAFNKMMAAFEKDTGIHDLTITSAYRDLKDQEEILQEKINLFGKEHALRWAMLPGYSEHHSGYAMDLSIYTDEGKYVSYRGQEDYSWINDNCYHYGFIRRYADEKEEITGVTNEEWHYRYVGVPHAHIIMEKNFCLEEYIEYLKQYTFDEKHLDISCESGEYDIYFVPSQGKETLVPVPKGNSYAVSGNNEDGFIVTVSLS